MPIGVRQRLWSAASDWMVIAGLCLVGYGIVYWWNGFPYPTAVLLTYSALGCLVLGGGMSLRQPATEASLWLATGGFALSSVLLIVLYWMPPWSAGALVLFAVACVGGGQSLIRLRRRRRNRPG